MNASLVGEGKERLVLLLRLGREYGYKSLAPADPEQDPFLDRLQVRRGRGINSFHVGKQPVLVLRFLCCRLESPFFDQELNRLVEVAVCDLVRIFTRLE